MHIAGLAPPHQSRVAVSRNSFPRHLKATNSFTCTRQTMAPPLIPSTLLLGVLLCFLVYRCQRQKAPFPPGPPSIPILGNALQLPMEKQWVKYREWAEQYGDIVHVSAFGQHIILLNSETTVFDLLERRSAIYSDRPRLCMSGELVGWSDSVPMCAYGNRHREYRRLINEVLAPRKLEEYHTMEEDKALEYLRLLVKEPASFLTHARCLVAAIIFDISHGHTVVDKDDPMMELAERANDEFSQSALPGAYLCDALPILRYIPEWTGARFKQDAKRFRKTVMTLRDGAYEDVTAQLMTGTAKPSFTQSLIERNQHPTPEEELTYKWASVGLYGAGADTTVSAVGSFFLAMSLHPEIQERAHAELLKVVGSTRLPRFSDRADLPYIWAIIKEVHRWNPVTPLALPHRLMQDDIYQGYHIPGGSVIFANPWAIMHDPEIYPAPFDFNPERFLFPSEDPKLNPDPRRYMFGFGRRSCPGQYLAEDVLYITIVTTLAVFRIGPAKKSKTVKDVEYTSGVVSHPKDLECIFTPRSEALWFVR
ncbi:Cytochrome P450 [Mycena venus]|uniref:Cytochrome P450 n=1 Tax=Mycena venus TaxID=2733690 RepID=A0A8H7D0A2_9AGAR|nr:Cytochrome P450 [Mycena venus]